MARGRRPGVESGRRGARAADRRAHRAELPRAAVRRRDAHRPHRASGAGGRRRGPDPRHAQDDARSADAGEGRRGRRRRRQPPLRAMGRGADQGEPHRRRRRRGGGGAARAGRGRAAPDRGRGPQPRGDRRGAGGRSPCAAARQHDAGGDPHGRGARRGPRDARGVGRRDAGHGFGLCNHKGRRLRLDGGAHPLGPRPRPLPLPGDAPVNVTLTLENIPAVQEEVRALARERGAVILAHNYQAAEVQEVADFVGDSLGLSQQAARSDEDVIAFCGVHFMAETASILCPEKTVLLPDADAGCSLADSITAEQLRAWKARHPDAIVVMYVNPSAEVKAETDYCVTSSNAVAVVEHILHEHGPATEILFGPDMFLGAYVEKSIGRAMHVWDGECHVHAGIRPRDIADMRAAHPGADFLIHPECGCSTSVMEYVAAGDVDAAGVHMLSTGGMLGYARTARPGSTAIVATETGMLHGLRMAAPDVDFVAANEAATCRYMKMITLPKLRDALRAMAPAVKVSDDVAERARLPIERMVAIS